jgi:hypothetical protein
MMRFVPFLTISIRPRMKAGTEVPPNKLRNGLKFDNAEAPYPRVMS